MTDAFQLPVSWPLCFLAVVVGASLAGHGLVHLMGVALLWEAGRTWRPALRRRCPDGPGRCLGTCSGRCGCCPAALFVLDGARLIGQRDSHEVAQAWFQGLNPQLDDRSPARLLREGDLDEVGPEIVAAARAFVVGG